MKPNFIKLTVVLSTFLFAFVLMPSLSKAQDVAPVGVTIEKASQLVVWYDQSVGNDSNADLRGNTLLQVTNGSIDTSVNIHVQIFADNIYDATERCREHNFNDTLTPTDTVQYVIGNLNLADNDPDLDPGPPADPNDPGGNNAGNPIPIDVDYTRGFIVVTPVDSVTLPRRAIAFNNLFASVYIFSIDQPMSGGNPESGGPDVIGAVAFNAMGREAVDFATGALAADGTLLNGVTNGYRILQPDFLSFAFDEVETRTDQTHVVSIAFSDNYDDPNGEYRAEPATAIWNPLMFNQFEVGTSCLQHTQTCFVTTGLNDEWESLIADIIQEGDGDGENGYGFPDPDDDALELCEGIDTDPGGGFWEDVGWVKISVTGLSGLDNNVGIYSYFDGGDNGGFSSNYARWMFGE